jgi:hypothetical protein
MIIQRFVHNPDVDLDIWMCGSQSFDTMLATDEGDKLDFFESPVLYIYKSGFEG